jgi:C4-type Zn-finger protein
VSLAVEIRRCPRCGARLDFIHGPAEEPPGRLWVLSVYRCKPCGYNQVEEKLDVAQEIAELMGAAVKREKGDVWW